VVLRWYVNVCARVLCGCIHTKFQLLEVNETISEGLMFSDIRHYLETDFSHKFLHVYVGDVLAIPSPVNMSRVKS
jgi:hypothetical protein